MVRYLLIAAAVAPLAAATPTATIQKPKAQTVTGGICRLTDDGSTLGVNIGPNASYGGSLATLLWRRILPVEWKPREIGRAHV